MSKNTKLYHSIIDIILASIDAEPTSIVFHQEPHNIKLEKLNVTDAKSKSHSIINMSLEDDPDTMLVIDEDTNAKAIREFINTNF